MKNRRVLLTFVATPFVLFALIGRTTSAQNTPPSFQGTSVEEFLKKAKITGMKDISEGVTLPKKATLELDGVKMYGVFKTIDEYAKAKQLDRGIELEFQDSWRTEVAAYEMDK